MDFLGQCSSVDVRIERGSVRAERRYMCGELLRGGYSCGVRRLRWLERYREFCGIGIDQREE